MNLTEGRSIGARVSKADFLAHPIAIFAIFIGSSFRLRAADVHLAFDMSPTTKHPAPMSTKHPAGAPGTRARARLPNERRATLSSSGRAHQSDRVESDSLRARERLRAPAGVRREAMTPRFASPWRVAATRAFCVAALALLATGTATAAATDLSTPDDDCTNVDVFAIFPRHVDGQVVHARFDVRALDPSVVGPGSGRLGHVEGHSHPDHDVRVTTTLCLPRDQSFFLIASGNATRGSAFGRFTVTVASLEYHNLTIFSAGSEWTRGAEYDSDHPVGEGDGTFRFLEDQGVGPPLWDTPDSSRVYQLHGRARFDTWRRNPSASRPAESSDCEALVAVVVGCTSYGNGARPTDMGWDIYPASGGDAVASTRGDRFAWGANVVTTHCLSAGSYEFVARDFGNVGRGWNAGTSLAVLELTPANGMYFHGRPLGGSADSPTWFDRGESAKFTFDARGSAAAATGRRVGGGNALGGVDPTTVAALGAVHLLPEDAEVAPRARTIATRRALLAADARSSTKASVPVSAAIAAIAAMVAAAAAADAHSRRRRDAVERVSLLHSEATGAYGADDASTASASKKSDDGSPSRVVVAAAFGAAATFGAAAVFGVARYASDTSPFGAALGKSLDAPRGVCGAGVRGCSLLESPDCATRTYAYRRGMLAHLQGGAGAARVLTPYGAHVVTSHPSTIDDVPGACDRREFIEGGDFDWSEPRTSATARKGAALGGGVSGCRVDVDAIEGVTVDECRRSCAAARGCESFHAFHVAGADGAFAPDDLSCRLCGRGGHGAFLPPAGAVETFRAPARCITRHNFTLDVRSPVECAAACDATDGCDAFNYGYDGGDCLLLALGPDAKDGMLWRGSGVSPTGVAGYATFYVADAAEIDAASEEILSAKAGEGRCASKRPAANAKRPATPLWLKASAEDDGATYEATTETATTTTTADRSAPASMPEVMRMDDSDFVAKAHPTPMPTPVPTPTAADIIADVNAAKPTDVNAAKPTEVNAAKPTEVDEAKPTDVNAAKPTDVNAAKPTEVNEAKPTEVNAAKPTEVNAAKPTDVNAAKPTDKPATTVTPAATPSADDDTRAADDIFSASPTSMATPPPTRDFAATPEDSVTSASAYPADPSVMPTPSAVDADAETTASPKQTPKSAPSPKPTPEVRPRSEARNPRPRPTPVSTPTSDSGGVAEDVSASTDIEDDLHEPVAADEDTGPRPASNVDASTSAVAVAVADAVADAAEDAARAVEVAVEDVENAVENVFDSDESSDAAGPETAPAEVVIPDGATSFPPPPTSVSNPPPPAPVTLPERTPTLPACTDCARPPCRAFVPDVAERDFIGAASSCCQALKWTYGDTMRSPHACGRCRGDGSKMSFRDAEQFCFSRGAGLCAAHQVAAAGRTPGCAISRDAPAWTSTMCGEEGGGRVATRADGGGEKTCVENLDETAAVLCCANTCNTYTPNHMCPSPEGARRFWQATARMGLRETRAPDGDAREANRRVALPTAPRADLGDAKLVGAEAAEEEAKGTRVTRDVGVPSLRKEAVLTAAHQALGAADDEA